MPLSLQDAINLGLKHNLGLLFSRADTRSARGQRWQELSSLLPQRHGRSVCGGIEDQSRPGRIG